MTTRIQLSSKHSGWRKDMPVRKRRRLVLRSTTGNKMSERYLEAARHMQALSNLTTDTKTKKEASKDAQFFFTWYRKMTNK